MNKEAKSNEDVFHICTYCNVVFEPDKNSMSIVTNRGEIYFCNAQCLKQFWVKMDKNDKGGKKEKSKTR
jgi:ribosomal protein L24E